LSEHESNRAKSRRETRNIRRKRLDITRSICNSARRCLGRGIGFCCACPRSCDRGSSRRLRERVGA
jgi:hypothetical protein